MTPVTVCTAVFNRHDLLINLLRSLAASTRVPDLTVIVDHGYDESKVEAVTRLVPELPTRIVTLLNPGAAYLGNWCLRNFPDDIIFTADDIIFTPDAIEKLTSTPGDFILPKANQNAFACHLLRHSCFEKVGPFDEAISPRYLYFEDCDYARRMHLAGVPQTFVDDAIVIHHEGGSQTYRSYTPEQMDAHHEKFRIARENYIRKWGGEPHHETFTVPYNGECL